MENISKKDYNDYVVIGLGRFGKSLALNLAEQGKRVLAIDNLLSNVEEVEGSVTHAAIADVTQKEVLKSLGVQNFDCAVICIGGGITASMLATLGCKELGVKYIIAKAQNEQHKALLEKVGADLVIFPEVFMSKKLSLALSDPYSNEILKLSDKYKIVEIKCPAKWDRKTIIELNVRKKFNITVIFIKRDGEIIEPTPELIFEKGDSLIIAGNEKNIEAIENKLIDTVDFKDVFTDAFSEE
ncbi:MAG: TrkA family potassium uptake protein [Clostridia bacterium]|nr:TrkA family potassium uptake protein [Clostridia bacterium]